MSTTVGPHDQRGVPDTAAVLAGEVDANALLLPGPEAPAARSRGGRLALTVLAPLLSFAAFFGLWELLVRRLDVQPIVLPSPTSIAAELWDSPGFYARQSWVTLHEALLGFALAFLVAIALAVVISHSRVAERAVMPLVTMVQVTPIVALAAPLVLWLGFGLAPKVLEAALIVFVPLLVNAVLGFRSVDPSALELLRSVDANRREVFVKLRVPASLPSILTALKISPGLALIGALVAEWQGSSEGLGYQMVFAAKQLRTVQVWACIAALVIMGVALVTAVTAVERRVLRWQRGRAN